MSRLLTLLALLGALCALAGCSKKYQIEIQSDTCWSGLVNDNQSFSDCGNASYKVMGSLRCVRVTKQTVAGFVRVRIDGRPWAETTATQASAQACE